MENTRATSFIANLNKMSMSDLIKQHEIICEDHPYYAENGTLDEGNKLLMLIEIIGEMKFGNQFRNALEAA